MPAQLATFVQNMLLWPRVGIKRIFIPSWTGKEKKGKEKVLSYRIQDRDKHLTLTETAVH